MNRLLSLVACAFAMLLCGQVAGAPWDTVVLRDDFETGVGTANMPDPNMWVVNHTPWWWVQGRTFFPSPTYHPAGPFPRVENGVCTIEHHHYNPYHLETPKTTFLGGEIHTVMAFGPTGAYRIEARVRCFPYPNGLVTSFFTYGYDGSRSDEIDFEFVSNKTNDDANYPSGDPVLTNPWDESIQDPEYVEVSGLDLTEWNVFRIYWYPGQRVEWTWIAPIAGETLIRRETSHVPDESMAVYFNFWAPTAAWADACDGGLQPAQTPPENQIHTYEIDYVEVRVPEPLTWMVLATGTAWLLMRKSRNSPRQQRPPYGG